MAGAGMGATTIAISCLCSELVACVAGWYAGLDALSMMLL